jgi:hypothetical protein
LLLDPTARRAAWESHRAALMAEAEAAGFTPAAALWFERGFTSDVLPGDVARAAWSRRFYVEWGY